jgi:hypothetical protein
VGGLSLKRHVVLNIDAADCCGVKCLLYRVTTEDVCKYLSASQRWNIRQASLALAAELIDFFFCFYAKNARKFT